MLPYTVQEYSAWYQTRNINAKPVTNPAMYNACKISKFNGGTNLVGVTSQYLICLMAHSMRWNPYLTLLGRPRT